MLKRVSNTQSSMAARYSAWAMYTRLRTACRIVRLLASANSPARAAYSPAPRINMPRTRMFSQYSMRAIRHW